VVALAVPRIREIVAPRAMGVQVART
jgi:hypothetical protein